MIFVYIVFVAMIVGMVAVDWIEESKHSGKTEETNNWILGFSVIGLGVGMYNHEWVVVAASVLGFLHTHFAPKFWKSMAERETTLLMLNILVETWYWDRSEGYWYRRPRIQSLLDWAKENGKGVGVFELDILRQYQKFHWIYLEGSSSVELPEPHARHTAPVLGRMYGPHKIGPYSSLDL